MAEAITKVGLDNQTELSKPQTDALVNLIINSADARQTGGIDRQLLKVAIITNIDKVSVITNGSLP